ncbi:MAG: hypothetical protein AUK37_05035 [Rhodobacterales bacterium CG2_30_65_12]|nr:MAG: hypothetical protein AUK37_05035 [Rhodobacterales bacterium CG2_30_65_12]
MWTEKRTFRLAAAIVIAAGLAGAAQADPLRASEPQSFIDWFFDAGYPAQLSTDGVGDPYIEFRNDGVVLPLWFYDCTDNSDCKSVQFYFGYKLETPVDLAQLNDWNGEARRYTRAYQIEDSTVRLEMDIFTGADGISGRDFESLLRLWLDRLTEFEGFIGW